MSDRPLPGERGAVPFPRRVALSVTLGRVFVALAVGLGAAMVAAVMAARPDVRTDLVYYWTAARLFLAGVNPYTVTLGSTAWPMPDGFYYPLPAVLLTFAVAWAPLPLAAAIFSGVPLGLLAWQRTRTDELWRLLPLAHPAVIMAIVVGQWSPWLLVAMVWPSLGFLFAAKPTIGLACWLWRPSRAAVLGALLLVAGSLAVSPFWPRDWLANIPGIVGHPAPLVTALGGVTALAVVRWRDPDARLLLAMACVPQLLFFADQAPLTAIARTKREAVILTAAGWVAWLVWWQRWYHTPNFVAAAEPWALVGCYWPAVAVVLLRRGARP